ncbi:hypothetical protein [Bacillus solitudinis]|uniref:hypothetical protein n=1 Tax=Bacillus solitudinis TaxID=2014074 RepID=UPI0012FD1C8C|nr:hypothetical protein [Bacillus solitudinis]
MIPSLLIQIAIVIILIRSGFAVFNHLIHSRKSLLELLYDASIFIIALSFLI